MQKAGLVHKSRDGVRLLGKGEIKAKLDIEVAGASASAVEAVEKAGGTVDHDLQEEGLHEQEGRAGQKAERRAKSAEKRAARRRLGKRLSRSGKHGASAFRSQAVDGAGRPI